MTATARRLGAAGMTAASIQREGSFVLRCADTVRSALGACQEGTFVLDWHDGTCIPGAPRRPPPPDPLRGGALLRAQRLPQCVDAGRAEGGGPVRRGCLPLFRGQGGPDRGHRR